MQLTEDSELSEVEGLKVGMRDDLRVEEYSATAVIAAV